MFHVGPRCGEMAGGYLTGEAAVVGVAVTIAGASLPL